MQSHILYLIKMRNAITILTCAYIINLQLLGFDCGRLGHLAESISKQQHRNGTFLATEALKFKAPIFCGSIKGPDYGAMMAAIIVTRASDPPASWEDLRKNWFPTWGALISGRKVLVPGTYLEEMLRDGDHVINVELNDGQEPLRNVSLSKITRSYYNLVLTLDKPVEFNISSADSSINRICVDPKMKPEKARDVLIVTPKRARRADVRPCDEVAGRRPEKLVCVPKLRNQEEPKLGDMLVLIDRDRYWLLGLYSPPVGKSQGDKVWAFNGVGEIGETEPWRMY